MKVCGWFRNVQAPYWSDRLRRAVVLQTLSQRTPPLSKRIKYVSDSDSEYGRLHLRRRHSPPVTRIKNAELYVHKDYEGLIYVHKDYEGLIVTMPQDSTRAAHTTVTCASICETYWARNERFHALSGCSTCKQDAGIVASNLPLSILSSLSTLSTCNLRIVCNECRLVSPEGAHWAAGLPSVV